jgi:hypothetical protein
MAATLFPAIGTREDLLDVITVVDAKNTPISSTIARSGPDITNPGIYSYQADGYATPSTDGVLSNSDVSSYSDEAVNRVLLSARAQKFRRAFSTDDFAANVATVAGVGKKREFARATATALVELKRDVEATIGSDNDSAAQNTATPQAFKTRGLGKWIQNAAQTDLEVASAQRTPTASINSATTTASLSESDLQAVLQSIYQESGTSDRLYLVCGPSLKRAITNFTRYTVNTTSGFANMRQTPTSGESNKLVANISLYEGDFSTVEIVPSLLLAQGSADAVKFARGYVVNSDHLMLRYGRKPRFDELPDMGGGPRGLVDCIVSLACLTPRAMGKFSATS